jgi:hypothetical protein
MTVGVTTVRLTLLLLCRMLSVIVLYGVIPSFVQFYAIIQCVIQLNVIILSVLMQSVIMLSFVVPLT